MSIKSNYIQPYARGFEDVQIQATSNLSISSNSWTPYPRTSKAAANNVFNSHTTNRIIHNKRRFSGIDKQGFFKLEMPLPILEQNQNHSQDEEDEDQEPELDSLFGEHNLFYQYPYQNQMGFFSYYDPSNDFLYPIRTLCDDHDLEVSSINNDSSSIRGSGTGSMLGLRSVPKQYHQEIQPSFFAKDLLKSQNGKRKRLSLTSSFGSQTLFPSQSTDYSDQVSNSEKDQEQEVDKQEVDPYILKILNSLSLAQKYIHEFIEMHQLNESESNKQQQSSTKLLDLFNEGEAGNNNSCETEGDGNDKAIFESPNSNLQPRKAHYLNTSESTLTKIEEENLLNQILFKIEKNNPDNNVDDILTMVLNKPTIMYPQKSDGKKREKRNYQQTNFLLKEFQKREPWDRERLTRVSKQCGLTYKQVYKWSWEMKKKSQNANQQYELFLEASNGIQEY